MPHSDPIEPAPGTLFYAPSGESTGFVELLDRAGDPTLDGEIACARIALLRVLRLLDEVSVEHERHGGGCEAQPSIPPREITRLANSAFRGASTIARLLRDRRALVGEADDRIAGVIAAALDELSEEWGIDL
jgi:hypothetical protein